jgi:putative photosynthetic complex assembly protein
MSTTVSTTAQVPENHTERDSFPRGPLYAIGAILALTLVAVSVVRVGELGSSFVSTAAAHDERTLRFEDRADGSIAIIDVRKNETIENIAPGTNGFLRGALRGLARERKRMGAGAETPFVLTARSDGRLTLDDPVTKRQVDLKSFGPTNASVFEQLLQRRPLAQRTQTLIEASASNLRAAGSIN